jgi:signal peptidase II
VIRLGLILAVLVLAADQASKAWILYVYDLPSRASVQILPVLDFSMVWNHGVTFGLLNSLGNLGPLLLTAIAVAMVIGLLIWLWRAENALTAVALGGIAGGAVGNIIDRLRFGAVVDFLHMHALGLDFPYVFNVADSAICCGVGLLLIESLLQPRLRPPSGGAKERT